ncbi:MAG: TAT-variant-translocated molybdopterin oxidoreductase [Candidatus Cyclobacteriaceae bacterium M3_2C_046]
MKVHKKQYWKGIEQLTNDPEFVKYANKEFAEEIPVDEKSVKHAGTSRRDFLKLMGFSMAAASLAACEAPVRKAIPYVNRPLDLVPGVPNYYASTFVNKGDYCSILVKTREGRPIKIEGNALSSVTRGGTTAQVQASVLNLYDSNRLPNPLAQGQEVSWNDFDNNIRSQLQQISANGGQIRIISNSILSPTTKKVIADFTTQYSGAQHIMYDPSSCYGMVLANQASFGRSVIPSYFFSRTDVIVGISADFLGTWMSPVEHIKEYSETRKLGREKNFMSRHYQFETILSTTGANADYRTPIKPSQEGLVVAKLYNLLAEKAGAASLQATDLPEVANLEMAANDLWSKRGRAVVVCGSNDPAIQQVVNNINMLLQAYQEKVIDLDLPVNFRQGDDEAMYQFVQDVKNGNVDGVIFFESNPVYDFALGKELAENLENVSLRVSITEKIDETAALSAFVAPNHHFLESWNDAEPKQGFYSLIQPAITPLFNTRQAEQSLLVWANAPVQDYYTYLQNNWRETYFAQQDKEIDFQRFWDSVLFTGVFEIPELNETSALSFNPNLSQLASQINETYQASNSEYELVLYQKVGIGVGSMANNPWLQEMPDPISKVTWDNYVSVPLQLANELGMKFSEGSTTRMNVNVNGVTMNLPVLLQPGQARGTIAIALGYGRTVAGPAADNVGVNVFPLVRYEQNTLRYDHYSGVSFEKLEESYSLAKTQTHHTYMGRETVIQESILPEYKDNPMAGRYTPTYPTSEGPKEPESISLWDGHSYPNHHWGMIVDLNSCIGCGACTVACQVENNVPVVGRQEVINRREMHWIRIDRYYSSDAEVNDLKGLEQAAENPEVIFQPVMCQQCNNAPCETVCPVAATTHSSEGLNQMTYNRCIGTRYCANNCPYKVRRFNWFKYHDNAQFMDVNPSMYDDLGKMVLNPDVTVRSRGVMEKCTFCVQRIQYGKLQAKKENRRPEDGEIVSACAEACPANAIVFGDLNDPNSTISQKLGIEEEEGKRGIKVNEPRAYNMLVELNVKPNVFYLTRIKNKESKNI